MNVLSRLFCLPLGIILSPLAAFPLAVTHSPTAPPPAPPSASKPEVHTVLFVSSQCPDCERLTEEVLPLLQKKIGPQLVVESIDIQTEDGTELFQSTVDWLKIPRDQLAVPMLIVDKTYLIGSQEIRKQLPQLVQEGVAKGGVPPPAIPSRAPPKASRQPPAVK